MLIEIKKNPVSAASVIILFTSLVLIFPWTGKWHVIAWDTFGYYLYLPELFIWHDPAIANYQQMLELVRTYEISTTFYQVHDLPNGNHLIQYPIGMAILFFPAFIIGHAIAIIGGFKIDGLSKPYEWAMLIEHFLMLGMALALFRKFMLLYFSDKVTTILLFILTLGTNFFYNAYGAIPSTHIYLLVLYGFFMLQTSKCHQKPTVRNSVILGCLLGLITLCRVSDFLIFLLPLLWNIGSWSEFKTRTNGVYKGVFTKPVICILIGFIIVVFPQLFFWKRYTGEWIYYSYRNAGEGFDFLAPNTMNFLFSFRKGWFIYTPVMLLMIPGLWIMYQKKAPLFWLVLIFLCFDIYLLSSWSNWYYAGGFSQRAVLQSYMVFMMPLGYLFTWSNDKKTLIRSGIGIFCVFCMLLNLFQTWQYTKGIIHPSNMTKEYYMKVFGETEVPNGAEKLLLVRRGLNPESDIMDSSAYVQHLGIYMNAENNDVYMKSHIVDTLGFHSSRSVCLSDKDPYSNKLMIAYQELADGKDHAFIRVKFWYYCTSPVMNVKPTAVVGFLNIKNETYDYNGIQVEMKPIKATDGKWKEFEYTFLSPEVRSENDKFFLYFWIRGKGVFFADNIQVQSFVKK